MVLNSKKKMKSALFILTIFFFGLGSFAQEFDPVQFSVAKETLKGIKNKEYKKVRARFPAEIASSIQESVLRRYVDLGASYIEADGLPADEKVMFKIIFTTTENGMVPMYKYSFPFPAPKSTSQMPKKSY
jgi:hypothetical protein